MLGRSAAPIDWKPGAAVLPVLLPKNVWAAAVLREKVMAGVVVDVATEDVNSGERLPHDTDVTRATTATPLSVETKDTTRHPKECAINSALQEGRGG